MAGRNSRVCRRSSNPYAERSGEAIGAFARNFWADPERRRLTDARREIVAASLAVLANAGRQVPPTRLPQRLADRFSAYRDEHMRLFPDAQRHRRAEGARHAPRTCDQWSIRSAESQDRPVRPCESFRPYPARRRARIRKTRRASIPVCSAPTWSRSTRYVGDR